MLMLYDLTNGELLRTRKNPLTPGQVKGLRSVRPVGPRHARRCTHSRVRRRCHHTDAGSAVRRPESCIM